MKSAGEQIALVQSAINIDQHAAEIDALLAQERKGAAAMEEAGRILTSWRYRVGVLLAEVRRSFPARGPKAKGWGDFVGARGISLDSAARYIEVAEQVKARPELAQGGSYMDVYRVLGIASEPPARGDFPQPAVNVAPQQNDADPAETRPAPTPRAMAAPAAAAPVQGFIEVRDVPDPAPEEAPCPTPASPPAAPALAETPATASRSATASTSGASSIPATSATPTTSPAAAPVTTTTETTGTTTEPPGFAALLAEARQCGEEDAGDGEEPRENGADVIEDMDGCEALTPALSRAVAMSPELRRRVLEAYEAGYQLTPQSDVNRSVVSDGKRQPKAAARASDPYDPTERLSLLRHSPYLKDVPEEERPAVAAALRELADGLAPLRLVEPRPVDTVLVPMEIGIKRRLEAAEARVRELEQAQADNDAMNRRITDEAIRERLAAEARVLELEARQAEHEPFCHQLDLAAFKDERDDQVASAARRGYEQGEAEALAWIAGVLHEEPEEGATAEGLRKQIEAHAAELCALANEGGAGVIEELQREAARLRMERSQLEQRWDEDGPRRAKLTALLSARLTGPDVALLDAAAQEIAELRRAALAGPSAGGLFVDIEDPTEPGQPELTYEREEQQPRPGAAKKPKAKAQKAAAPASRWRTGDQVLIDTRNKGTCRATAICVPDGLFVVLRADPSKKLKAGLYKTKVADGHLRHDPATTPEDRAAGIREAVDALEDTPGTPPADWIEALKAALSLT